MAVIKIPSKHIYEMQNEKVIDNDIDEIEVQAKTVRVVNDSGNVYNEKVESGFSTNNAQTAQTTYVYLDTDGNTEYYGTYIKVTPTYSRLTIKIPQKTGNKKILSILLGLDENSNKNIKTSLFGHIEKGQFDGVANISDVHFNQNQTVSGSNYFNITSIQINNKYPFQDEDDYFEMPYTNKEYTNNFPYKPNRKQVNTTLNFINNDNLVDVNYTLENGFYVFNLIVLAGLEIYMPTLRQIGGDVLNPLSQVDIVKQITFVDTFDVSYYEIYTPKILNISFYGNTIGIDLQDQTVTVGNGKQIYSFQGNELVQTTNAPTPQSTYQKVLEEWQEGKELATIRCAIADYYDIEGNLRICSSKNKYELTEIEFVRYQGEETMIYRAKSERDFNVGTQLFYSWQDEDYGTQTEYVTVYNSMDENGFIEVWCNIDQNFRNLVEVDNTITVFLNLPVTFHIGDTVIPYIYTAKGIDEPMSYYADNTPKQFKVIGKGMAYNGRVFQKLTLQEK